MALAVQESVAGLAAAGARYKVLRLAKALEEMAEEMVRGLRVRVRVRVRGRGRGRGKGVRVGVGLAACGARHKVLRLPRHWRGWPRRWYVGYK